MRAPHFTRLAARPGRGRRGAAWLSASLLLGAAACGGEGPAPGDGRGDTPPEGAALPVAETARTMEPAPAERPGRPDTRTDTLVIEGAPQPVELRLVRTPAAFPLPFSAYVTPDFEVEAATRDDQPAVRFVAAFGGVRNENAFLEVALYPPGLGQADALERAARSMDPSGEPEILDEGGFDWAEVGWRWRRGGAEPFVARFLLGRHGDRWFQVLQRYPPEYGDGFGPRAALLLESLRWGEG